MISLWGQYVGRFFAGLGVTVELTALGLLVAVAVGAVLAGMRSSPSRALRLPARLYIDTMRSVPVLVLLFIAYYGLGQVGVKLSSFGAGVAALGVFYASLFAEVFRGGFAGVARPSLFGLALVGGNFFFLSTAPSLMRRLALLTPNGWALRGFTDLATVGGGIGTIAGPLLGIAVFSVVVGGVAVALSRRAVSS